jgi:hypothetical protein
MFCRKCGQSIAEDSDFCSKCGVAVISQVDDAAPATTTLEYQNIKCWRCGTWGQRSGQPCTNCSVKAPESRAASIAMPPSEPIKSNLSNDAFANSWRSRESASELLKSNDRSYPKEDSTTAANVALLVGYLGLVVAALSFFQGKSLLDIPTMNWFGTVVGANPINLLTGGFWGASPQFTQELVQAYFEAFGGVELSFLMDRTSFANLNLIVSGGLVLFSILLIVFARKMLPSTEGSRFFFFFWS